MVCAIFLCNWVRVAIRILVPAAINPCGLQTLPWESWSLVVSTLLEQHKSLKCMFTARLLIAHTWCSCWLAALLLQVLDQDPISGVTKTLLHGSMQTCDPAINAFFLLRILGLSAQLPTCHLALSTRSIATSIGGVLLPELGLA